MAKAIVTSLTKPVWHRAWHSLCYINVAFAGTKKSLVFSRIASNDILELSFLMRALVLLLQERNCKVITT